MNIKKTSKARIVADDEIMNEEVIVAPEATDLLFEAEDVAELVAEITGETVEVEADENEVTFSVGDEVYTVEAEGDEELLEASTKIARSKKAISASRKVGRTVRRLPNRK